MSSPYNKFRSSSLTRLEDMTMQSKNDDYKINIMTGNDNRLSSSPLSTSTAGNSSNNSPFHTRTTSYIEQPIMYNNNNFHSNTRANNSSNDKSQNDSSSNDSFCRGSVMFAGKSLNTVTSSSLNDATYYSYFDEKLHYNPSNIIMDNASSKESEMNISDVAMSPNVKEEFKSSMGRNSSTNVKDLEQLSSDRSQSVLQLRQEMSELCHVPMRELVSSFQSYQHVLSLFDTPTLATNKSAIVNKKTTSKSSNDITSSTNNNNSSSNTKKTSTSCPYYNPHATLHIAITDEFGTSQWENIDTHRTVMAVVVVINASLISIPLNEAVDIVLTVFDAHFKDKVCRCVIIHDAKCQRQTHTGHANMSNTNNQFINDLLPSLSTQHANKIMCFSAEAPVRQIAAQVMDSIARYTVMSLCSLLHNYETILSPSSINVVTTSSTPLTAGIGATANMSAAQQTEANSTLSLRTPLDKMTNLSSELKRSVLLSRMRKRCGDCLLLLGQHDKALNAYGSTAFGGKVDFFWCSAVVESIAAVRYAQLQVLVRAMNEVNNFLINLQSSAVVINHILIRKLDMFELLLLRHSQQLSDMVLPALRKASVPVSMKQRLLQEVHEPLKVTIDTFKQLIAQLRQLLSQFTKHVSDITQTESRNKSFSKSYNDNKNIDSNIDSSFDENFSKMHYESHEQHLEKQEENEEDRWEISQLSVELKSNVQELIRAAYMEIDIYLKEVKRQLRKVPNNASGRQLRDRE